MEKGQAKIVSLNPKLSVFAHSVGGDANGSNAEPVIQVLADSVYKSPAEILQETYNENRPSEESLGLITSEQAEQRNEKESNREKQAKLEAFAIKSAMKNFDITEEKARTMLEYTKAFRRKHPQMKRERVQRKVFEYFHIKQIDRE